MKKRNGFTLIELIATIAILTVVSLVATITYNKIRKDVLEHQYLNLKTLIETAAIKYSSKNGYSSFFVQDLIENGFLEPDDETDVYDPRNDKSLNCHILSISVEKNGMLSADMSDKSYDESGKCKTSSLDIYEANLRMNAKIEGTSVTYPVNSLNTGTSAPYIFEGWTRFNLDITADPSSIPESLQNGKYVWNRNNDVTTIEPNRTITTNEYGVYNNYYYLDFYTEAGTRYQAKMLYKFDNEKPTIYRDSNGKDRIKFVDQEDNSRWAKSKNVFIYASDKNGSGLSKIYIGREKCEYALENNLTRPAIPGIIQVYEVKIETGDARNQNEEYNVCVIDKAGNIAKSKTKVTLVDITPPRCDHVSPDLGSIDEPIIMANWIRPDRTIRTFCADDHYITEDGVERHLWGSGCVQDYYDATYSPTTINGTTDITDNVGWVSTCEYRVLVDKTPPICGVSEGESTVWQYEDRTIKQHYHDEHSGPLEDTINTYTYHPTTKVGDHVVTDNVGNTETCHPNVYVDKTPPYISYVSRGSGTYYKRSCPRFVSFTWVDDESGFASGTASVYYNNSLKVDKLETDDNPSIGLWVSSSMTNTCSLGDYKIDLQGTDNVGNTSSVKTFTYTIIPNPPPPPESTDPVAEPAGCPTNRFSGIEQNPTNCATGYYMAISDDAYRCPGYGCLEDEDAGSFQIYMNTSTGGDESSDNDAKDELKEVLDNVKYEIYTDRTGYIYQFGINGKRYFYYNFTSGGDGVINKSKDTSMMPISYETGRSRCSNTKIGMNRYRTTCEVTKKRCTKWRNGQEYLRGAETSYTYVCCKNANSDSHCKSTSSFGQH